MVALQHERPPGRIVIAELTAGRSCNGDVVMDLYPIQEHSQNHAIERSIHCLPFASRSTRIDIHTFLVVERSVLSWICIVLPKAVENLKLVPTTEVDTAVAVLWHEILDVQLKVAELLLGDNIYSFVCVVEDSIVNPSLNSQERFLSFV